MPFTLHVEHEVIGGETVLEEFEGVSSFNDPPMVDTFHISFADEREMKKLTHGHIVRATDDKTSNDRH